MGPSTTLSQASTIPICSMYGIFTYICVIFGANVGKYSIHGAYGIRGPATSRCISWHVMTSTTPKRFWTWLARPSSYSRQTERLCWTSQYSLDIFHHRDQRAESWVLRRPEFVTRLAKSSLRFSRIHQHRSSSTFFQMHVFMGRRLQLLRWGACNRDESKGNPTLKNSSGQFGLRWWDISGFIVKHGRLTWFDQQRDVISS